MSLVFVFKFLLIGGVISAVILLILTTKKTIKWKKSILLLGAYGLISFFILIIGFLSRFEFFNENIEEIIKKGNRNGKYSHNRKCN